MNERIKELAEQAKEYANEQNELYGVGYVITFKEKFAELIVRECASLVVDDDNAFDILKHFGVE
jgi:hypothetical protein